MEQNEYIQKLMKQFISSQGIKNLDLNSKNFKQEFVMWIDERQKVADGYLNLLEKLQVPYNSSEMVEVGKGKYDSIVLNNGSTILLTPYINEKVNNPLSNLRFVVNDNKTGVITKDGINKFVPIKDIMTHNPYSKEDIENWEQLHNHETCFITLGIYGKINDQDRKLKIKLLEEFKRELYLGFETYSYESKDNYYYAITSHSRSKSLRKIK